ncbi:DUF2972 domain-containing protein [Helicobacter sp.]|uniref:DUF2972 domain-containing protein n=1 Tax=Helicobacter sp. TaxID=218 RepID=UPI0019A30586|nr:DUF2972 domain-containing protein [Helicobacter sp.]MBD5165014.1 DUF2972 domain-containing protein [Helicobacter sp.]
MTNPHSAKERIQNHLAYKLGLCMIAYDKNQRENLKDSSNIHLQESLNSLRNSKTILSAGGGALSSLKILSLPKLFFQLFKIKQTHNKEKQFYQQAIAVFPSLKYPPLESCKDYKQSLSYKYHLTYLLGEVLIKANRDLFKGGYLTLNKEIKRAKEKYQKISYITKELKLFNQKFYEQIDIVELADSSQEIYSLLQTYKDYPPLLQTLFVNFSFLEQNLNEIFSWLNSKEFKEQYLDTNHPYPPLLNPERLTKDSNNPYPNLSYGTIPAELAWDLNLPLPPYYKFIMAKGHGSGGAAMGRFFMCCGVKLIYQSCRTPLFDFCAIYQFLLLNAEEYNIVGLHHYGHNSEFSKNKKDRSKFFYLFAAKVPLLFQTRDSIGQLKHALKRHWTEKYKNKILNVGDDFMNLFPNIRPKTLPMNLDSYRNQVFIQHSLIYSLHSCNEIIFVDMAEISKENAFNTLCGLSKKLGFNEPKEKDRYIFEAKSYKGFLNFLLPINFVCKDIKIKVLIPGKYDNLEDCTELLLGLHTYSFAFFASKKDLQILQKEEEILNEFRKYLSKFAKILEEKLKESEEITYREKDILEHLRKCGSVRRDLKEILDEQLIDIKKLRPDIVKSWKYYQEFERMCEEMDGND